MVDLVCLWASVLLFHYVGIVVVELEEKNTLMSNLERGLDAVKMV